MHDSKQRSDKTLDQNNFNPRDKNNAIRTLGAELVEAGHDFDESKIIAEQLVQMYVPAAVRK